jgi:hypothetical protein
MDFEIEDFRVASVDGEEVLLGAPRLDIERSGTENFVITIKSTSRGKTRDEARESIEDIIYEYELEDSTVSFNPYFVLAENSRWRDQEVDITVKVPEGKAVFLGEDLVKIIHDIENVSNTWDGDMVGKRWEMKLEGLTMEGWEEAEKEEVEVTESDEL